MFVPIARWSIAIDAMTQCLTFIFEVVWSGESLRFEELAAEDIGRIHSVNVNFGIIGVCACSTQKFLFRVGLGRL